jgi:hypothetical protein
MASIKGRYEYPDGATPGKSKEGGLDQNIYDDQGNLVGHARFIPDDDYRYRYEDDYRRASDAESEEVRLTPEEIAQLAELLAIAILAGVKVAPHVRQWWEEQVLSAIRSGLSKWDEKALPAIKAQWSRLTRSRKAESRQTVVSEVQAIAAAMPVADSPDVTSALAVYQASMSSTEARERFVAALVARAFSDEQMRILRETPVRAGDALDLGHLMEAVTPEEVARHINQVLQSNPTLLEARTGAGFGHLEEPLRLTDGKK